MTIHHLHHGSRGTHRISTASSKFRASTASVSSSFNPVSPSCRRAGLHPNLCHTPHTRPRQVTGDRGRGVPPVIDRPAKATVSMPEEASHKRAARDSQTRPFLVEPPARTKGRARAASHRPSTSMPSSHRFKAHHIAGTGLCDVPGGYRPPHHVLSVYSPASAIRCAKRGVIHMRTHMPQPPRRKLKWPWGQHVSYFDREHGTHSVQVRGINADTGHSIVKPLARGRPGCACHGHACLGKCTDHAFSDKHTGHSSSMFPALNYKHDVLALHARHARCG
jgi:hypothetical protein